MPQLDKLQLAFSFGASIIANHIGGFDGALEALIIFVFVDYLTGVFCAINEKKLSSEIGFKGILQKMLIFLLVIVANIVDSRIIGEDRLLRTAVIFFYLSNEGISILENSARLGLPVPDKLKDFLAQIKDKGH